MSDARTQFKDAEEVQSTIVAQHSRDANSTSDGPADIPESTSIDQPETVVEHEDTVVETADDVEGDSEAETLIQSPEKKRNLLDSAPTRQQPSSEETSSVVLASAPKHDVQSRKRKRSVNESNTSRHSNNNSRHGSPLTSPATNPRSDGSDSEHSTSRKARRIERVKAKRNGLRDRSIDSESKTETVTSRRRRPSEAATHTQLHKKERNSIDGGERRETRSATYPRHSDNDRSPSPQPTIRREHRRGASTQLTTHDIERKKRGRPPLLNTQRHRSIERTRSPDSEGSNSPAPPRSAISKLASHDHDTMSPAKTGPRKRRDKNGRTAVARHANSGNLDLVKIEISEHHEDLNLADNAGNTPLQIAALEGHIDIVEYLLLQGCEIDTRNIDKDTPLIDAVENGHVDVVRLLLENGANPRLGNAKGDEPYELVPEDDENYDQIRKLLAEAKERDTVRNKALDQGDLIRDGTSSRAASAASPRDSPPVGPRSPPAFASRRRTGRSESTRNDLLWQAHNQPTLAKLAAKGDVQGVANILNILQKAETESLIAAAKAGHEEVLQHLLAMGDPDPDPPPVRSLPHGYNTPLLAAIGRGHIDVVKLLISQSGFDPTKKPSGKAYFELARERRGAGWQQEYEVLKHAYDRSGAGKGRKQSSPRRTRDAEKLKHRPVRRSSSPATQKKSSSSPTLTHKSITTKSGDLSPKEKRKVHDQVEKRKTVGSKQENSDPSIAIVSDLDQTVHAQKKGHRVRRSQSDLPTPRNLDIEQPSRRRRLITGKEHRRNKSTAPDSQSSGDEPADMIEVKQEDRLVPTLKRSRSSQTPDPKASDDSERGRAGLKKRRTVESSPEETRVIPPKAVSPISTRKSSMNSEMQGVEGDGPGSPIPSPIEKQVVKPKEEEKAEREGEGEGEEEEEQEEQEEQEEEEQATETDLSNSVVIQNVVKSPDIQRGAVSRGSPSAVQDTEDSVQSDERLAVDTATLTESTGNPDLANEEDKAVLELLESERMMEEMAVKLDAERRAREEAEKADAAVVAAAAEEATRQEEARRAAEKQQAEEAQARKKAEEEIAIRKKQEEERQEQIRREELERQRRQQDLENERRRIDCLPAALGKTANMLDNDDPLVRDERWLKEKFLPLFSVNTRQLSPDCSDSAALEKWVPSFQVAGLLATKDLHLQSYASIEKRPVTQHERERMWGVARKQLSFDYLINWGEGITINESLEREKENREKFMDLEEVFWVKLSDFLGQTFRHTHLAGINLRTQPISLKTYQEVFGSEPSQSLTVASKLTNGIHLHHSSPPVGVSESASN